MIAALLQPSVSLGRRLITTQGREDETPRCETNFCDIATCEITRPAKGSMRVAAQALFRDMAGFGHIPHLEAIVKVSRSARQANRQRCMGVIPRQVEHERCTFEAVASTQVDNPLSGNGATSHPESASSSSGVGF